MKNIPVLIIGGGPVGLSMALALARQKICSVVIEKHSGTTLHPRARGVNARTMELFRQWGNASELLKFEHPKEARRFIWAHSLQGDEITRVSVDDSATTIYSPMRSSLVAQDHVEESLYHTLLSYKESEVQFLKEFISFEEDEEGITARIFNRTTHLEELIRAKYLIAADGAHSTIRKQLGIEMDGPDNLGRFCSIYCDIDISTWTSHRPCIGYFFTDKKIAGRFLASIDGANRWIVGLRFAEGMSREDFTDDYCKNEIRRLVNVPNLRVNIINKSFWTMAAQSANQYSKGRVFLMGDAAHRLPPTGGFGMNTGIQDAHNLAWKLAYVLHYSISDKILDSYQEERAPIAKQNISWSTANSVRFTKILEAIASEDTQKLKILLEEQDQHLNYIGLDLGFIYHSGVIFSENAQTISLTPSKYLPTSLPGIRAPHVKLTRNGTNISTLDLFERDFVLLVGPDGQPWKDAAHEIAKTLPFPLAIYRIADDGDLIDSDLAWQEAYEMSATGAVLVRPDGHIAWRSKSLVDHPEALLRKALQLYG